MHPLPPPPRSQYIRLFSVSFVLCTIIAILRIHSDEQTRYIASSLATQHASSPFALSIPQHHHHHHRHPAFADLRRLASIHEEMHYMPRTGKLLLYWRRNIVIAYELPESIPIGVQQTLYFSNIIDPLSPCNASDFDIYFRLAGPEIVSGLLKAVANDSCVWTFSYTVYTPGTYIGIAKLLGTNLGADFNNSECGVMRQHRYRHVQVLDSFDPRKFYDPPLQCCELCTRMKRCVGWSSNLNKHCELYSHAAEPYTDNTTHIWSSGRPRRSHLPPPIHLGCVWNFEAVVRCVDEGRDDLLYTPRDRLVAVVASSSSSSSLPAGVRRWVEFKSPCNTTRKPVRWTEEYVRGDGECWMHSNLRYVTATLEPGSSEYLREAYLTHFFTDPAYQGGHVQYKWTGNQYSGTDDELDRMLRDVRICFGGASLRTWLLHNYQIRTGKSDNCTNPHLIVNTMRSPHTLWHDDTATIHRKAREAVLEAMKSAPHIMVLFVLAPPMSGEREPHDTMGRARVFNRDFVDTYMELTSAVKHHRVRPLNPFEVCMAWALDAATQLDGMHFKGPPLKAMILEILERIRRSKRLPHPQRPGDFYLQPHEEDTVISDDVLPI